ncbi:MAG TPA: RNA methyltransferase [Polyangiaceae bacterium]|nr:RNA methyltransferase [Polyangiaceae bacterium]
MRSVDRRSGSVDARQDGVHELPETIQGLRAGLAVFARRRHDILRVVHTPAVHRELTELARWAAAHHVPCVEAAEREVDRLAASSHHEGLCVFARPRRWFSATQIGDVLLQSRGVAVALDRVRNPYNVGAILRSAAFFGIDGALIGGSVPGPDLAPTAVRVAEGGAEELRLARTTDLADTLARLRSRGVRVFGADARAPTDALRFTFARPSMLVVGHEREGLTPRVRAQCDTLVAIAATGRIDSLNVAVAAGVLLAAMLRSPQT